MPRSVGGCNGPDSIGHEMLRVCWATSGGTIAELPLKRFGNVRTLKHEVRKLCGIPQCAQKLLHNGMTLDDDAKLESPMDLQLVLSVGAGASSVEVSATIEAACDEHDAETVCLLIQAGANVKQDSRLHAKLLLWATEIGHTEIVRLLLGACFWAAVKEL